MTTNLPGTASNTQDNSNCYDYKASLNNFMAYALSIQPNQPNFDAPTFSIEPGRVYDRITISNPHKSVFAFIRKSTGDVLKASSYKTPAKHARGTIYIVDSDVDAYGIDCYGPIHLR